jgi:hypothetical protein
MLDLEVLSSRIRECRFKDAEFVSPTGTLKTGIRRIEFDTMLNATFMRIYGANKVDERAKRYNFCLSSVHQVEDSDGVIRLISFPFFVPDKGKSFVLTLSGTKS